MQEKNGSGKQKGSNKLIRDIAWSALFVWTAAKVYRRLTRKSLDGNVVLITGGARGLGLCLARELGNHGAKLAICSRNSEQLSHAKEELENRGYTVMAITADLRQSGDVDAVMDRVVAHYGRIDMLINNAGEMIVGPENVMTTEDYKAVMDANVWTALNTVKAALPHFERQGSGHIVNISSIGGRVAVPHMLPYSVSKFAMTGLSQGLAAELKRKHITVSTVTPNLMRTGSPRNITVKGDHQKEYGWFKLSASLPLLSQNAATAAKQIVEGIRRRETDITLTLTAKVAVLLQALIPEVIHTTFSLANHLLQSSEDTATRKGWESESRFTKGGIGKISDNAAEDNNEL